MWFTAELGGTERLQCRRGLPRKARHSRLLRADQLDRGQALGVLMTLGLHGEWRGGSWEGERDLGISEMAVGIN